MAAQLGKSLLLKINVSGSMTTLGGMRSTSMTLNDEMVDITNKDSGSQRALLAAGGVSSMSISASGVFTDSTAETTLRSKFATSTFESYNIIVPDLGTYAGTFQITSLEYAGEYNGEATYSVSLESSGSVTFSAA
mgnify:FL=1|tara:strand:- start:4041 stop:4445 length:405 start_codon:yes stop_codon:yes gene_type:complete